MNMKECVFTKLIFLLLLLSGNKFFRFVDGRSSADAADDAGLDGRGIGNPVWAFAAGTGQSRGV